MQTARRCAADSKKEDLVVKNLSPVTRRELLRQSSLAAAGLAAAPLLGGPQRASAQGGVELVFWDSLFVENEAIPIDQWFITQAIARFESEFPDIHINRVAQSSDIATYDQILQAANLASNGPDVLTHFAGGGILSFTQFLEPLDQYFSQAERDQLTGWDSVREDFKPDGAIVAVPYGAGSYFEVLYNRELMQQAGVDPDAQEWPATWEELLELAQGIKDAGVNPFAIGEQQGYTGAWVMATLVGGQIGTEGFFGMRAGTVPLNDPSMITGYEQYKQPYDRQYVNGGAGSLTNEEGQQLFVRGEGAMLIQGGWFNKAAVEALGEKVGNFPIPTLADAPHAGAIAGGPNVSLGITNYSEHKPEAVEFLKFLLRPKILDLYVSAGQVEPSNHEDADLSVIQNPLLRNQAEWLQTRETIYPFDNIMPQVINDLFYRTNASIFTGRVSPEDGANELQSEYEDELAKQ
jgi:raffinose/stachyose/melibiose transport system substrate-binding protein